MGIRQTLRNAWRWMTLQRIKPKAVPKRKLTKAEWKAIRYYAQGLEYQEHEDKIILDAKKTDTEIAKELGRSRAAIQQRRYRLNRK